MKRLLVCGLVALVAIAFSGIAMAGTQDNAKIGLHVSSHNTTKAGGCNLAGVAVDPQFSCDSPNGTSGLNTTVAGGNAVLYDIYAIVLDGAPGAGVGGATFGVAYNNLYMSGWTVCADQEFAGNGWPNDQGGNVIAWDTINNCQNAPDPSDPQGDVSATLGFFYVYAYDGPADLCVTTRNYIANPDFKVADCGAAESDPAYPLFAGKVGLGGTAGYSPCVPTVVPVEETTWGSVKSQFSGE